jgi:hypothetical protein
MLFGQQGALTGRQVEIMRPHLVAECLYAVAL